MAEYRLKPGKVGEKVIGSSPSGYTLKTGKTGEKVVGAYQKIENGVVGGYKKIEKAFVDRFLEEK